MDKKIILNRIVCFIFPARCPYCSAVIEPEAFACEKCLNKVIKARQPITRGASGFRCVASFKYSGRVGNTLCAVKFSERTQYIPQLARVMAADIESLYNGITFDLITAVPMHPTDLRRRGYNQSVLLAKELSDLLSIPYADTLIKIKRTKKQHRLKFRERKTNLKGAFKTADKEAVKEKNILLIDDIITSGITLGSCCGTLAKAKTGIICCAAAASA